MNKRGDNIWEIPRQGEMRVPAVIYASGRLIEDIRRDQTLAQARNVACLPGIVRSSYVMPDAHQGYGFVCVECGKECEVPFEPREGRPVYCSECYGQNRPSTRK